MISYLSLVNQSAVSLIGMRSEQAHENDDATG